MLYVSQILFFFGAIGVFNSFIVALYLLINTSYSNLSNRLFGLFLLVLNLRVLKGLLYAFSTEEPIWFLQSGPSFFLLIGPLLFSYVVSVVQPKSFWLKNWIYHILFWIFVVFLITSFIPFQENNELTKTIILPVTYLQGFMYIVSTGVFLKLNFKNLTSIKTKWLLLLTLSALIVWASYAFINYNYFVSGSIIFSVLFYSFFVFFLLKRKTTSIVFEKVKKKKTLASSKKSNLLIEQLNIVLTDKKLYTDPNLKLLDVAKRLNISPHELSKLINERLEKNFTELINEFRIKEAKQLLENNSLYTVEAIGHQCGFNSKSAFYKAFKKFTHLTPTKYKSQL